MSTKAIAIETVAAAVPVAGIYFAGWAYLSHVFSRFGIDATEFDIPLNTVLVFAFQPLNNGYLLLVVAGAVLVGLLYSAGRGLGLPKLSTWPAWWNTILAVLAVVGGLKIVDWSARAKAADFAATVWGGRRVHAIIPLNSQSDQQSVLVQNYNECRTENRFVQIFVAPERAFLLCVSKFVPDQGSLYVLDKDRNLISVKRIDRVKP